MQTRFNSWNKLFQKSTGDVENLSVRLSDLQKMLIGFSSSVSSLIKSKLEVRRQ